MQLANDICRCVNFECTQAQQCARFMCRGERVSVSKFKPDADGNCEHKIDIGSNDND